MRKVVWLGAVLIVASAAAVYMAADYAARHPDSYLGRCAAAAVYISARSNPVTVAADMVRGDSMLVASKAGAAAVCGGALVPDGDNVDCEVAAKPQAGAENDAQEREPAEAAEVTEPIQPEVLPQEPNTEEMHWACPGSLPVVPMQTEEPTPVSELGADSAISEFDPAVFNREVEANEVVESATVVGPVSIEVEVIESEAIPVPAEEEDEAKGCAAAACPCNGDKPCCAGCCWLKCLMKMVGCCPCSSCEEAPEAEATPCGPEILEMPVPCDDDEPQDEGVEECPGEEAPSNWVPSYHHYHGGCPYMGGSCPYYRGTPIVTPVETPKKPRRVKKKVKQADLKPVSINKFWKQLFSLSTDDETQKQMGIDTMEFRPSDDLREPPGHSPF